MDGMMGGAGMVMLLLWGRFGPAAAGLVGGGAGLMLRNMSGSGAGRSAATARQKLDVRYARGEEYRQRRADLEGPKA